LPEDLGKRHIMVNLTDFRLQVVEDDSTALIMKVVVGTNERRTPVLSGKMTYMQINPFWNIPQKLAREDILPIVWQDPEYLGEHAIRVYQDWSAQAEELDAEAISWPEIEPTDFAYRLRQDPGPKNALGRIKFMFPNQRSVYLHDTPSRYLFRRAKRLYSSGCVRVEKPLALAEYLLKEDPAWNREKIMALIESNETRSVGLPQPIPVHILYWTAWVDEADRVHFREDVYSHDDVLEMALEGRGVTDEQVALK
jgi:murein L,D-transpeptidase YcbB/YkuD